MKAIKMALTPLTCETPCIDAAHFRAWLRLNHETLKRYDVYEIFIYARMNGFSDTLSFRELAHHPMDTLTRTSLSLRLKWNVDRELNALSTVRLEDQWYELWRYTEYGKEFPLT